MGLGVGVGAAKVVAAPRRLGAASVVSGGSARPLHEVEMKSISTEASRCSALEG